MGEILSNYNDFKDSNESLDQETPSGSRRANRKKSKNRKIAFNKKTTSGKKAATGSKSASDISAKAGELKSKVSDSMGPKFAAITAKLKEKYTKTVISADGTETVALDKRNILKTAICVFLAIALIVILYVGIVIATAPKIQTDNIYTLLSQSSILYDDEGNIVDTAHGGENRTIVEISQIPEHTQAAFIALEDKTFEKHNGFNIIRIFGALKDAVFNGGHISGTSTITQQLARNLYLEDRMGERSISRKVTEAYYTIILESKLNKDEILEAYLNTINFGQCFGIQAAAQTYFSKDVEDLTIAESASLAAIPQYPQAYKLITTCNVSEIDDNTPNLIRTSGDTAYLWNDAGRDRMLTCLYLMHDQEYISDKEYKEAKNTEIKDMVKPNLDALSSGSNYFADYVITTVINDLQEKAGYTKQEASDLVYNGGIQIYTTMDSQAQDIMDKEFNNSSNFPKAIGYSKDADGNIKNPKGSGVLLYAHSNYFNKDGQFVLNSDEYKMNDDGTLTIYAGKRLHLYNTTVNGKDDVSVEFKNMFVEENGIIYSISGGYINIPQDYKSKDKDGNLVVSEKFFDDYPKFFQEKDGKLYTKDYTLNQRVIQPQAAMVIVDNETGQVKAMSGGRKTSGRMLYNRATIPNQPGSSIKPLAVYAAALQKSLELSEKGQTFSYTTTGFDKQGTALWGDYITAGSIVDDEPLTIEGRVWPKNSYSGYRGLYTFRTALQQSVNICAVKILAQVGVDYSADLVEKFGISTFDRKGDLNLAALGMGGMVAGTTPLDMASAYTVFVNDGVLNSPTVYTKVTTRNGDLLLESESEETEVLDPGVAWIMRDILRTVVTEGIGSPAAVSGVPVGGKTGTTDDQYDIWFCGFTPKYSAALWIGNDVNMKLSSYSNATARMWGKIMGQITDARGGSYSEKPDNVVQVTVDTKSGLLATSASGSHTRNEYFISGTQPTATDTSHQTMLVCSASGYQATPSCPSTKSKTGILRPYEPNTKVSDYKNELPHYFCNQHNPNPNDYPTKPGLKVTIVDIPVLPPSTGDDDNSSDDNTTDGQSENE